jgi:hypothetical protein
MNRSPITVIVAALIIVVSMARNATSDGIPLGGVARLGSGSV